MLTHCLQNHFPIAESAVFSIRSFTLSSEKGRVVGAKAGEPLRREGFEETQ